MVRYTPERALIVVDVQNDFADPEGSLYVQGAEDVVRVVNAEIVKALAAGAPVFYTQDWHPESTPHFEKDGGPWPVHCVKDSWGADFPPRLLVAGPSVHKGSNGEDGYSGFTMQDPVTGEETPTALADMIDEAGASEVVIVGLALDYCVKQTALDARRIGYPTTLPLSGTAAVNLEPGDGDRALSELVDAGVRVE
jgi:nicotinamidase/pyrazinamidase